MHNEICQNEICQNEICQNEICHNEICQNEIDKYKETHPIISKLWIDLLLQKPNDLGLQTKIKKAMDCMQSMRDLTLHEIALVLIYFKSL